MHVIWLSKVHGLLCRKPLTGPLKLPQYIPYYQDKTNDTLLWTTGLAALQKSTTNDTLILTSVSIVLNKVGLTIH